MKIVSTNHPTILVDEIGYDHNKLPVGVIHTSVDLRTGQLQNMLFPDADTWGICKRMTQVRGIGMKTARDMVIKAGVAAVLSSVRKGDSESFLGLKGMGSKRGKDIAKALFPEAKTLEKKANRVGLQKAGRSKIRPPGHGELAGRLRRAGVGEGGFEAVNDYGQKELTLRGLSYGYEGPFLCSQKYN